MFLGVARFEMQAGLCSGSLGYAGVPWQGAQVVRGVCAVGCLELGAQHLAPSVLPPVPPRRQPGGSPGGFQKEPPVT